MSGYVGILEKDPGTLWGIWFPDLPGCVTAATTAGECLAQAPEVVDMWLDDALESGEALPPVRTIEDLRDDPRVASALAKGDAVVTVASATASFGLDRHELRMLDAQASRLGVSRTDFVRTAVRQKIAG